MGRDEWDSIWLAVGVAGALALGVALTPLRGATAASNLAFAFLAFTVVIAELGGRGAALTTAVASTMSLNFFLMEPYLTLSIDKTDDAIAFVAMAACGLVVGSFGRRRVRSAAAVSRTRSDLDALRRIARRVEAGEPWDGVLDELRRAFGLERLALRGADERLLATAPADARATAIPTTLLEPEGLLAADGRTLVLGPRGFRLPEGGGRLRLAAAPGVALDLWAGDAQGLPLDDRKALAVAASIVALGLARGR
jgi:two-component system sensor histidine kinase KdpD